MADTKEDSLVEALPDFAKPPVSEVALGIEFVALPLRAIDLAPLGGFWAADYPHVEEKPPVPPTQQESGGPTISFGQPPMNRHWWVTEDETRLLQVQADRLVLNWRKQPRSAEYPRYAFLRQEFRLRLAQFCEFAESSTAKQIRLIQAEVTYINDLGAAQEVSGRLEDLLAFWVTPHDHHLAEPDEVRWAQTFSIQDFGVDARLYVSFDTQLGPDGQPAKLLTLTVRGKPIGSAPEDAFSFFDMAHRHIVSSFAELTTAKMHERWERQ